VFAERVLVLSPHTDDAELAAGGFIHRLTSEHKIVRVVHFSDTANINGLEHGRELRAEALAGAEALGISEANVFFGDFLTRNFISQRQEILDFIIHLRNDFQPDLVLCPGLWDQHQDHGVIRDETIRAFKTPTILGFDSYWNQRLQDTTAVVELRKPDIKAKLKALSAYESQKENQYMNPKVISGQARMRGVGRGFEYAEAFHVLQLTISEGDMF
jgi:N-acetylglucosamine malate deacetylase 1